MSVPLSRMRPLRRVVKARDEVGHGRLARAAAAHQRDHRSAGHGDVEVAHHRPALAILELDVLEADLAHHARRVAGVRPVRLVVAPSPSTSNTRSMAASERCSSEKELTMFQTGFSSRNVYHWKAMMSPMDAPPREVQVAAVPDDHDVDDSQQQAPGRPDAPVSRRCANSSLRSTVCRPRM